MTRLFLMISTLCLTATFAHAQAVRTEVRKEGSKWTLLRAGKPYFIQGAGGSQNLELLKASGGNSFRTWGVGDNTQAELDNAQKQGLTVTLGLWLGHPEHGFNYEDPKQVAQQLEEIKKAVLKYKDHPALLAWGVGNEMEANTGGNYTSVWTAVEEVAKTIKALDPNHPTMTVIAEIGAGGNKPKQVEKLCPSVDILGINSYGGLPSLAKRLKESGWTKPYVVTEFGPNGPWEVGKTAWGASLEPTSTDKGKLYQQNYENSIGSQKGWCLGSYTFLWGNKFEATATWFGMFLPETHERLAPVDTMTYAWTGKWPTVRVPEIAAFTSPAQQSEIAPGSTQKVTCEAKGTGPLTYHYEIRPETEGPSRPDPGQKPLPAVAGVVPAEGANGAQSFTAPTKPGPYRFYVYIKDGKGGAATANFPFLVK